MDVSGKRKELTGNRKSKRGLWGLKKFEHPAEYKKRIKAGDSTNGGAAFDGKGSEELGSKARGVWGLMKRLLGGS